MTVCSFFYAFGYKEGMVRKIKGKWEKAIWRLDYRYLRLRAPLRVVILQGLWRRGLFWHFKGVPTYRNENNGQMFFRQR